jgi:hypothetical protein
MRGEVRDCRPLFIGAGKAVTPASFELRAMAVGEENIPPLIRSARLLAGIHGGE